MWSYSSYFQEFSSCDFHDAGSRKEEAPKLDSFRDKVTKVTMVQQFQRRHRELFTPDVSVCCRDILLLLKFCFSVLHQHSLVSLCISRDLKLTILPATTDDA
jgi:hypothetical protein